MGLTLPKSTSATPAPSLPGSHATTNASAALMSEVTGSGRPVMSTTATLWPAFCHSLICAMSLSVLLNDISVLAFLVMILLLKSSPR